MQMTRLFVMSVLFGSALAACGDDGGKGGGGGVDAPKQIDAAVDSGGGGSLTGLGQRCVPSMQGADCPANAPGCLSAQGSTMGYCTPLCLSNGTMMTDAQKAITSITPDPSMGTPASTCTSAFTGTVGTPLCATIIFTSATACPTPVDPNTCLTYQPPDQMLMASKTYTNLHLACLIACGTGNTCPGGLNPTVSGQNCTCK